MIPLAAFEEIIDDSGIAPQIEAVLPAGARRRQLSVRTLLAGMMLALADGRPAHLTRVRRALVSLTEDEQRRLGVIADWKGGPHRLTYRQAEYTFGLVADALGKDEPDGLHSPELQAACDQLLEASVPARFKDASRSLAVDWTDLESFSRPPPHGTRDCADPEAPPHRRRRRRLPPRPVPRRHGQDPLPAAPRLDAAGPGPARDPAATGTSPGLLQAAGLGMFRPRSTPDQAEARLPVRGLASLLQPAHWRRARLRHRQGPLRQRHRPRLVPLDGPHPADAARHDHARRPQPAHPHHLGRAAGRKRPPRRQGPAPENPPAPPQDPHRAHILSPALTAPAPVTSTNPAQDSASTPAHAREHPRIAKKGASAPPASPARKTTVPPGTTGAM